MLKAPEINAGVIYLGQVLTSARCSLWVWLTMTLAWSVNFVFFLAENSRKASPLSASVKR